MDLFELLKIVVLGIVEGITEWLPISSTGHLILFGQFLDLKSSTEFINMFNVVIQLGAILAVVVIYFKKLWPVNRPETKLQWDKDKLKLWLKIIIACIPSAVIGLLFEEKLEALMSSPYIVAATLIIYGVIFIVVESLNKNKEFKINDLKDLTIRTAVIIGLFQVLSMIPGTSRSGITIIGAMLIGTARTEAAEFTFFLGIPTMIGASLLKILGFIKDGGGFTGAEMGYLLVGMAVSFVVSVIVIKFLMSFIKKHDFKAFGIYRIILGIAVIAYLLIA
jgi:undecaprenyl-diphosphatase